MMGTIAEILALKIRPKERQTRLVEAVCCGDITVKSLIDFFLTASDVDKGTCADIIKHVSGKMPHLFDDSISALIRYINYKAPRVKWGIAEMVGNFARYKPEKAADAIPYLLKNTDENKTNTTVVRWCTAYGLSEIAINDKNCRMSLLPEMERIAGKESNPGVKKVYLKALKKIQKID
ncbi:MAG: hypothetical protein JW795_13905 [Chitinivibrionales bacterium]|nr:hypothetical protein [Chitinivibrionales bacterium]